MAWVNLPESRGTRASLGKAGMLLSRWKQEGLD